MPPAVTFPPRFYTIAIAVNFSRASIKTQPSPFCRRAQSESGTGKHQGGGQQGPELPEHANRPELHLWQRADDPIAVLQQLPAAARRWQSGRLPAALPTAQPAPGHTAGTVQLWRVAPQSVLSAQPEPEPDLDRAEPVEPVPVQQAAGKAATQWSRQSGSQPTAVHSFYPPVHRRPCLTIPFL